MPRVRGAGSPQTVFLVAVTPWSWDSWRSTGSGVSLNLGDAETPSALCQMSGAHPVGGRFCVSAHFQNQECVFKVQTRTVLFTDSCGGDEPKRGTDWPPQSQLKPCPMLAVTYRATLLWPGRQVLLWGGTPAPHRQLSRLAQLKALLAASRLEATLCLKTYIWLRLKL